MTKSPIAARIEYLTSDGAYAEMSGWRSNHALGVLLVGQGFASVMLLSGKILEDGFPTLAHAHAFNTEILGAKNMLVGATDIEEFFDRAGGRSEALEVVETIKAKVLKREMKK